MKFTLPATYPEVLPEIEVLTYSLDDEENEIEEDFETNLEPEHVEDLKKFLEKTVSRRFQC
jgi:hypothetical protein